MKKTILILFFLVANIFIVSSQLLNDARFMLQFDPGINAMVIPSRSNTHNYPDGEEHFKSIFSPTLGIEGRLSVWPVYSSVFGYCYFHEESRGWLFLSSQNSKEYGHRIFLGYDRFKLNVTYSKAERKSFGYFEWALSSSDSKYFLGLSEYFIQHKISIGVEASFRNSNAVCLSYISEKYIGLPSDLWEEYSNGFRLEFKNGDKYQLSLEGILDHPVYGTRWVNPPAEDLESLKYKSMYFKFSLIKSLNFNGIPYVRIVDKVRR
jgi:hypothetical protein